MITRRRTPDAPPVRRDRKGFTLVELMVAMMLFAIGMLALASSSAAVVRQMGEGSRMSIAASVAQTRIERLRTANCTAASNGTATTRGITEAWTVSPQARSAEIVVVVGYATTRGNKTKTYRSMVPCT